MRESGAVECCSISETGPISGWISDHHKRGPRLWSRYRLGNTLTARSVEGRVPKRTRVSISVTDCGVAVCMAYRQLGGNEKLVEEVVK